LNLTYSLHWDSIQEVLDSCKDSFQKIQSLYALKFLIVHNLDGRELEGNYYKFINEITLSSTNIIQINLRLSNLTEAKLFANLIRAQNNLVKLNIIDDKNCYL